ncbi:MAG: MFS transporter [Candidatus Heimdallarchaeota archaeon]|nr:MFS transporter [Candidatus Heimdallarchaeota archaeon]
MTQKMNSRITVKEVIRSMNYNVKLTFSFYAISSLSRSMWMGSVLSLYINIFASGSDFFGLSENEILGITSAASGITMTLFVFPAGYFADKFRRDSILRLSTFIGVAGLLFLILGKSIVFILVSMLLWGLFNAFVRPTLESIFADSVESGYRSKIYSWAHLIREVAMAIGPFLNIGLFAIIGNNYNLSVLRKVMGIGFALSFVSIILLFLFKDDRALGKESEAIAEEVAAVNQEIKLGRLTQLDSKKAAKLIPYLLITGNVIIGIGAGMTIKYFPIFFKDIYLISPIAIQGIMGGTSLATGLLAVASQKASLKIGRVQTIFLAQYLATASLLVIAIYPPLGVLIPFFIIRGSFMNAAQPLSRSILMDIIPKHNRGKWNSIEAIAWGLFWNVSALVGGFLVGDNNYNLCFSITTFIYILGLVPIILLIPLVGKEREALERERKVENGPSLELAEVEENLTNTFEQSDELIQEEKIET